MCLKHQFLSKYSIIFAKVAGCFVPRGVDRQGGRVTLVLGLPSSRQNTNHDLTKLA